MLCISPRMQVDRIIKTAFPDVGLRLNRAIWGKNRKGLEEHLSGESVGEKLTAFCVVRKYIGVVITIRLSLRIMTSM